MELSKMNPKENKRNLWKRVYGGKYQKHVTIYTVGSTAESTEEIDEKIVYMEDLEKRKQAYGICGECNEPEPINSDVAKTALLSECLDCQLDELDLDEINQDEENNTE
ncbi:unnamed protein product [Rhizophagus irregularis]|nr:unnamed protein product [Rhizophagus irregularis]